MKFELDLKNEPISNEALIADIQRVAKALGRASLRYHEYKSQGKFSPNTITRRFGGWNKALELAELTKVHQYRISDEELFKNLEDVWTRLTAGRDAKRSRNRIPSTAAVHTSIGSRHGRLRKNSCVHRWPGAALRRRYPGTQGR